jgi:hypothetical protein
VGVPTLSPASGTFASGKQITLSATSASYLCYRLDGTAPGCGTTTSCLAGSTPIASWTGTATISSGSNQVQVVGCDAAFQPTAVTSQTYTIGSLSCLLLSCLLSF